MRAVPVLVAALALGGCADLGIEAPDLGALLPGSADAGEAAGEGVEADEAASDADGDHTGAPSEVPSEERSEASAEAAEAALESETDQLANAAAEQAAADAPHVYMALQADGAGPVSIVFAIDTSRDNTPSDEPAIRITPEESEAGRGLCNPQQLRYYRFSGRSAERPVYGPEEAARGVGARELPEYMATAVSSAMMERGIAAELEDTRPQNICTRKLFQQTIVAASSGPG